MKKEACIQISDLQFQWPDQKETLLNIPELIINQQEHLYIQGDSGSGKSTLLNLLGGIIEPQQGDITILGQSLRQLSSSQRDHFRAAHIGYVFQQFNLVPYLSILDNVTLPCDFSSERYKRAGASSNSIKKEAMRLLSHLGLEDEALLQKPVTQLSVGQQQRVAAARAFIGSPEIIIADEPTSSLDANAQESFIKLLFDEVKSKNTTIVFVSHDERFIPLFEHSIQLTSLQANKATTLMEGGQL
ncbi:ABC transporter ATP-binding protein [Carboxylicivirga marina]|uniref:ABC transporter ATP-binding protein n=1 Tax=Carboxylicivirga marina TaxID=2800988 RepID=A0ABS1HGJ7_9BACT|nr:ABC transporter ATP-binding protein [Carboxylicivirga marina]MBK3516740.1 ABC transporter ATP-binding protein [Carboxylicivirga marina]